jgi:hypothetical protein
MIGKIFVVFALVLALLFVGREERVFHKWGVVGSCEAVRSPSGDMGAWYACKEGLLTGFPSLLGDDCTYETRAGAYEYWRCNVPRGRSRSAS